MRKADNNFERSNKIIAVSEQTKKDIIHYFKISPNKISVVYQGCNQLFQDGIDRNKRDFIIKKYTLPKEYLLYVGSIEKRKNLLTLIKTLKELPNQKLVVIGDGKSYKKECEKFINQNKLSDRVIFLKKLSIEDMVAIYQSAKIMIYPSIFEGFGIPIIEALFTKTPVITSKGGCFSEAGGPNSKYINPLSVTEIKEAILEIDKSPKLQKDMIEKGLEYAKQFHDKKIAKNLMHIYQDLN